MADDFSSELLALAGHGDEDDVGSDQKLSKATTPKRHGTDTSGSREGKRQRQGFSFSDEEDEDDEDSEEFAVPYPLEGKYKDEEDRAKLLSMSEIERESILYEREEEMARVQERQRLAERLRMNREAQRRSTREKDTAANANRRDKLSRLRALRQEKSTKQTARGKRRRQRDDDWGSDDSEDAGHEDGEEDDEEADRLWDDEEEEEDKNDRDGYHAVRKPAKDPFEQPDDNEIITLPKHMFNPLFEQAARGAFTLVKIGEDRQTQESVYRLCVVKAVVPSSRPYRVEGVWTNLQLLCLHGGSEKTFPMDVVSNQATDQKMFDRWEKQMRDDRVPFPTRGKSRRKARELRDMMTHLFTDEEVSEMVKLKKAAQRIPTNLAQERTALKQQLLSARDAGQTARVYEIEQRLGVLEELLQGRATGQQSHLAALARLNERNRKVNHLEIRKAEIRLQEERRRQAANAAGGISGDPFQRLKTAPRTFLDRGSTPSSPAPVTGSPTPGSPAAPSIANAGGDADTKSSTETPTAAAISLANKKSVSGVDDLIAQAQLDIDIDI